MCTSLCSNCCNSAAIFILISFALHLLICVPYTFFLPYIFIDSCVITACNATVVIVKSFGQVILDAIKAPPSSFVDLTREER